MAASIEVAANMDWATLDFRTFELVAKPLVVDPLVIVPQVLSPLVVVPQVVEPLVANMDSAIHSHTFMVTDSVDIDFVATNPKATDPMDAKNRLYYSFSILKLF